MTQQDVNENLQEIIDSIQNTPLISFIKGNIDDPVAAIENRVKLDARCVLSASINDYFTDTYREDPTAFDDAFDRIITNGELSTDNKVSTLVSRMNFYHILDQKVDEFQDAVGDVITHLERGMQRIPHYLDTSKWEELHTKLENL